MNKQTAKYKLQQLSNNKLKYKKEWFYVCKVLNNNVNHCLCGRHIKHKYLYVNKKTNKHICLGSTCRKIISVIISNKYTKRRLFFENYFKDLNQDDKFDLEKHLELCRVEYKRMREQERIIDEMRRKEMEEQQRIIDEMREKEMEEHQRIIDEMREQQRIIDEMRREKKNKYCKCLIERSYAKTNDGNFFCLYCSQKITRNKMT